MNDNCFFGAGSLNKLPDLIDKCSSKRIFLVTGKASYEKFGIKSRLENILKEKVFFRYSDFESNPKFEDLLKGTKLFNDFKPDLVIAIGGGSIIDTAKLLTILPADKIEAKKIIKAESPVPKRKIPFIAIPTTAGSGSEATHFAVAYLKKKKYSAASESLLADYCILDSELTYSLPEKLTAISAFDAFSQAIESYWAVGSTLESRQYAAESIKIITKIFDKLIVDPDKNSRSLMLKAAHLSGKAINISKTTAPHAVSYALTMHYKIPHGYAVILTLPAFFLFNAEAKEEKINKKLLLKEHKKRILELCKLLDVTDSKAAAKKIKLMISEAGFSIKLSDLGLKKERDLKVLVDNVNMERLSNNPARVNREDLRKVINYLW
jgi:alcohol dehydrogenase class IV